MKERERQEQIERRIPVGRSALALLAGEVSCRLHTYTQAESVGTCTVFKFFAFFSSPFLLNRSLLSLEGGGIKRSTGGGSKFHCVSAETLFQCS